MRTPIQVTLKKWGNSTGLRVPSAILHQAGLNIDDTVNIEVINDRVTLTRTSKTPTLKDLLALSPIGSFDLSAEDNEWLNSPAVGGEAV